MFYFLTTTKMASKTYIQENDWYITASKLKCFLRNPQEYYLQYVKKVELEEGDEEKRHFVVWTAFDDLVSYWEEFFLNKYYIDEGLLVDELKAKLTEKYGEFVEGNEIKKLKLPELRFYYYKLWENDKIRLTEKEGRDIMGMYREVKRQPIADYWNDWYEKQKVIIASYKNLKLKGTLDRFSEQDKIIRDWKTTGRFDSFEYDMEETFDYVMSMAFYFILAKIEYDIDCDVILDVVHKNAPYQFVSYKLDKQVLLHRTVNKIKPWLEALIKAYEEDKWEAIDPLSWIPIPRMEATRSPYYQYMDCAIQQDFMSPM